MKSFLDREEAGKLLADKLMDYANNPEVTILALPRGGVPVAYEVAKKLKAPLDVFLVRKLGVPHYPELAMGAIAEGNITIFNEGILDSIPISEEAIAEVLQAETEELHRRELRYRGDKPAAVIKDKIIILVDDGMATGATMQAAITALRQKNPRQIVTAVPVAARSTCDQIESISDKLVCLHNPLHFEAVGLWYEDFSQTTDEQVITLLKNSERA